MPPKLTEEGVHLIVQDIIDAQTEALNTKFEHLQSELVKAQQVANEALQRAESCEREVELLKTENATLKNMLELVRDKHHSDIQQVRELIEDHTNRQPRSTLTIKGIAQDDTKELWSKTEEKLVDAFTEVGIAKEQASAMIERAHRGLPNPKRTGPAPIFVKLHSWKQSEQVKTAFLEKNKNRNTGIFADQKYGPLTSMRRNLALQLRKELKANNEIAMGFVKFPAKLMVKKTHHKNEPYREHSDFSKEAVTFGTR